jgi:hypothetical protein
MRSYNVDITEVLKQTVSIEATSAEEAHYLVEKAWKEGAYILGGDDFTEVDFTAYRHREKDRGCER